MKKKFKFLVAWLLVSILGIGNYVQAYAQNNNQYSKVDSYGSGKLEVISTTPTSGDKGVDLRSDISIKFNSQIKATSHLSFLLTSDKESIVFSPYISGDTIALNHDRLKENATYTAKLAAGSVVSTTTNNVNESDIIITFTTTSEQVTILSTNPENGSTKISPNTDIKIYFDKNIKMGSGNITLSGGGSNYKISPSTYDNTLKIGHDSLKYNTNYTVNLEKGAVVDDNNNPCGSYSLTFTTIDNSNPLKIIEMSPENNEQGVLVNQPIRIRFNQKIKMDAAGGPILISGCDSVSSAIKDDTLIITTNGDFKYNTEYGVTVSPGTIINEDGYPFEGIGFSFKTSPEFVRLWGNDRYLTNTAISKAWEQSDYAVLATGADFPDALCASPLAAKLEAPILLTDPKVLPSNVEAEISRLKVKEVMIIGGTGAVSDSIKMKLEAKGIKCTRIWGESRYETAVEVAKAVGVGSEVFLATGENFPDALSVASYAASHKIPILLTEKNILCEGANNLIKLRGVKKVYGIGGTGVISNSLLFSLPGAVRIGGVDRYDTNTKVLKEFSHDYEITFFATGSNFPDALSGSALASMYCSPIILIDNGMPSQSVDLIRAMKTYMKLKVTLGGQGVVPDYLINGIFYK